MISVEEIGNRSVMSLRVSPHGCAANVGNVGCDLASMRAADKEEHIGLD